MKRGNILVIFLIATVVILFLGATSYFFIQNRQLQNQNGNTDQTSLFCGGIAGVRCPTEYRCKLDGNYPDAGGKCVKQGGIYGKATIGPTCPGAQRVGQNCTAPYMGIIIVGKQIGSDKGGNFEEVTRFQTNSDGSFRVGLPSGDFVAKRFDGGNYWQLSKTQIHIEGSDYINLGLTFDTGIR